MNDYESNELSFCLTGDELHLSEDDLFGLAGLAFVQFLADARQHAESGRQGVFDFFANQLKPQKNHIENDKRWPLDRDIV